MSAGPYDKAIQGFEALLESSALATHAKPVRLIKDSGHHLTSGYRHTAALEAEGFLRRNEGGIYLQGAAAQRTALSGFGFGRLAPVVPLVLRRLREETQHTAFLAIQEGVDIFIGPHSIGRASIHIMLDPQYRLEMPRDLVENEPTEATLAPGKGESGNRIQTLIIPIVRRAEFTATIGFVLNPGRAPNPALAQALAQAARQIAL
ncbi:MAG: hypothetical protein AAGI36_02790 [Pseudomonadota bacterium]